MGQIYSVVIAVACLASVAVNIYIYTLIEKKYKEMVFINNRVIAALKRGHLRRIK
jgi:hypothetical protein